MAFLECHGTPHTSKDEGEIRYCFIDNNAYRHIYTNESKKFRGIACKFVKIYKYTCSSPKTQNIP